GGGQRNIRANQDCSFRRQAEEAIAINPLNAQNMIAGQNDSRLGYNHCGYDWTLDGGNHWGDQTPPFWQYALLDNHTSDACSDPTVAFDSQGNAYVAGVIFDVNSAASSIVVAKSNAGLNGSFYHSPDPTGGLQEYRDTPLGVVSADASSAASNDKEFIAADAHASSPKHDNVYMTWTLFTGGHSPIYFSQSTNGGATWSSRIAISGSSVPLCGGPCNNDQGSQATVGAGGAVFVTFGNSNTGTANGQTLFVKCGATVDCSNPANWTAPVKVGDLVTGLPTGPNGTTGCPSGRRCIPPNGYRVTEFTSISNSIEPTGGTLYTVWADFRSNTNPSCTGPAATATPPCDNDVFYSFSTDGGNTWSAARDVTPRSRLGETAQWQPWSTTAPDGSLWVAYYDRHYGSCETTGCNDITATQITDPSSGSPIFRHKVAVAVGRERERGKEMPISGGVMSTLLDRARVGIAGSRLNPHAEVNSTEGCQNVFSAGGRTNTKVNQDCSLRRQAEEVIAVDPLNNQHMIAGQNDSRIGYNHCGYDWTVDDGQHWGDL